MSDPYPANITVEIDRRGLLLYMRMISLLPVLICTSLIGLVRGMTKAEDAARLQGSDIYPLHILATTLGISVLIGLALYFLFGHRYAKRYTESLQVTVEGPFLRIRDHTAVRRDRKLHFRSIVDYSTSQGPLMRRCGIEALHMGTTAGGTQATVIIPGVKDCLQIRDMLSEIDRLREHHP